VNRILVGDVMRGLAQLEDESVQCVVTSPPYWGLRDYGVDGQLGLERTPDEYIAKMVAVFREVNRVLRKDGTLWLNMGDCYAAWWEIAQEEANRVIAGKVTAEYGYLASKSISRKPWGR
jgi:DNA modification methylase